MGVLACSNRRVISHGFAGIKLISRAANSSRSGALIWLRGCSAAWRVLAFHLAVGFGEVRVLVDVVFFGVDVSSD